MSEYKTIFPYASATLVCAILFVLPFALITFPPITDLPQQTAQIRLFLQTLHDPANSPYRIQWMTPFNLSYLLLGLSWGIFGPGSAGKWAMLVVGLLWVLAIMLLARRKTLPLSSAILASVFFFSHVVYWGFYSFAIGWPVFVLWIVLVQDMDRSFGHTHIAKLFCVALLLYVSHVLWFIAGIIYLAAYSIIFRVPLERSVKTFAVLLPISVGVLAWYSTFSGSSMSTPPLWVSNPLERLTPEALTDSVLGGIYGPEEYFVVGAALIWIGISIWQNRHDLKKLIDFPLLLSAILFFVYFLVLPDKYMNTIRFAQRWAPPAMIALLLSFPAPKLPNSLQNVAAVLVLASLCTATAFTWKAFEQQELSGLASTLAALPENPKVLGLSMIRHSRYIKGYPFIQIFAYSQVLRGGWLNFSFAQFSSSLVAFKNFTPPWTNGLEWFPRSVKESDLNYFEFLIYGAPQKMQAQLSENPRLVPVNDQDVWRLYKIRPRTEGEDN